MIGEIKVFYQVNGDKFSTCDLVKLVKSRISKTYALFVSYLILFISHMTNMINHLLTILDTAYISVIIHKVV
jgi:hypothetical protein